MKITKDYEGLVQIENGDYVLEGDLIITKKGDKKEAQSEI